MQDSSYGKKSEHNNPYLNNPYYNPYQSRLLAPGEKASGGNTDANVKNSYLLGAPFREGYTVKDLLDSVNGRLSLADRLMQLEQDQHLLHCSKTRAIIRLLFLLQKIRPPMAVREVPVVVVPAVVVEALQILRPAFPPAVRLPSFGEAAEVPEEQEHCPETQTPPCSPPGWMRCRKS